jgi:drug/metabolite transporter (DMT)-like permease
MAHSASASTSTALPRLAVATRPRVSGALVGGVLAATAGIGWGAMFPIAKSAMERVPALPLSAVRYSLASLVLLALLAAVEGRRALRYDGRFLGALFLGSLGFAGFNLLSYVGLGMAEPQNAALVVATMPFLTLVVLRVRGAASVPRPVLAAILVGFLGVGAVITKGDPVAVLHSGVGGGEALVLIGAVCWVFYTLGAASFASWSPLRYTALTASAGTLTILAANAVAALAGWTRLPSAADAGAVAPQIAYVVLIGAVVAVLAWNTAVVVIGAQNAVLFNNLVPTTAFAIAVAGGYAPNAWELGGAVLAVGALVAANVVSRRRARRASR